MDQKKKPSGKEALLYYFLDTESSSSQQKYLKRKSGTKQKNPLISSNRHINLVNKNSAEKAVYVTHTQELSFEKFLKSRQKKP